jgi:toxin ParE1/3/4
VKLYTVVYASEARDDLLNIFHYIADASRDDRVAAQFVAGITLFCDSLQIFPMRGIDRGDIRPGLRVTNHDGRTLVAFAIDEDALRVEILGIFHGGQNYEQHLITRQ